MGCSGHKTSLQAEKTGAESQNSTANGTKLFSMKEGEHRKLNNTLTQKEAVAIQPVIKQIIKPEPVVIKKVEPVVIKPEPVAVKPEHVIEKKVEPIVEVKPEPVIEKKVEPIVEENKVEPVVEKKEEPVVGAMGLKDLKIMFIGDEGAGKSCVLRRLAHNKFDDDYVVTDTYKHETKVIKIGDVNLNMKLLDTPGFFKNRKETIERMAKANLVVFVYDSTDIDSYTKIKDFIKEIPPASVNNQMWVMVGNKSELPRDYIKVKKSEADAYCKTQGILNEVVSCSSALNFKKFFKETILPMACKKY